MDGDMVGQSATDVQESMAHGHVQVTGQTSGKAGCNNAKQLLQSKADGGIEAHRFSSLIHLCTFTPSRIFTPQYQYHP